MMSTASNVIIPFTAVTVFYLLIVTLEDRATKVAAVELSESTKFPNSSIRARDIFSAIEEPLTCYPSIFIPITFVNPRLFNSADVRVVASILALDELDFYNCIVIG